MGAIVRMHVAVSINREPHNRPQYMGLQEGTPNFRSATGVQYLTPFSMNKFWKAVWASHWLHFKS